MSKMWDTPAKNEPAKREFPLSGSPPDKDDPSTRDLPFDKAGKSDDPLARAKSGYAGSLRNRSDAHRHT